MSDFRSTNERDEAAANLARDIEAAGDSVWKAEISKGILRIIREIQETETRAFESAKASLEWNGKRYPESLLETHVRDVVYQFLAETFFSLHKRRVDKGVRERI